MYRKLAPAVSALLFCAAPGWASTFQIFEESAGSPGVTAVLPTGSGLLADIDYDASSAEGGSLLLGPSEITIRPSGDASLVAFTCELAGCTENVDYVFTPGNFAAGGKVIVTVDDPNPEFGLIELGIIQFDSLVSGDLHLDSCNYTDANSQPHTCDPFTLVQTVPEPGTAALLGLALGALGIARRRA